MKQLLDEVFEKINPEYTRSRKVICLELTTLTEIFISVPISQNPNLNNIIHCYEENDDTQKQFDIELKNHAFCMQPTESVIC